MSRARSMIGFVNRYVSLAGRSCCAGRSWVGLDRSLARWGDDAAGRSCEPPSFEAAGGAEEIVVGAPTDREPDDGRLASSSPARR